MGILEKLCELAGKEVGVREEPDGSNRVKYNDWYYGRSVSGPAYPWCMVFMQWLAASAGLPVLRTASCTTLARWAKERGEWVTKDFCRGDWVEFDFSGRRKITQHVGLVIGTRPGYVVTIEGNTSGKNASNGGQVQRRERRLSCVTGAWRPPYEKLEKEKQGMIKRYRRIEDIPKAFQSTVRLLTEAGVITGYGGAGTVKEDMILDLSHDMVRMLVFGYRGGAFDRALLAAGKSAAVPLCPPSGGESGGPA